MVRVQEIQLGDAISKSASIIVKEGGDVVPLIYVPLSTLAIIGATTVEVISAVDGTSVNEGGTQSEGPYVDTA